MRERKPYTDFIVDVMRDEHAPTRRAVLHASYAYRCAVAIIREHTPGAVNQCAASELAAAIMAYSASDAARREDD